LEEWKELDYYLRRLTSGDGLAQEGAVDEIYKGLREGRDLRRVDEIVNALMEVFQAVSDPNLRGKILEAAVYAGFDRDDVRRSYEQIMRNHDTAPPSLILDALSGLFVLVATGEVSAVKGEVAQTVELYAPLLLHEDTEVVLKLLELLRLLMGNESAARLASRTPEVLVEPDRFRAEPWFSAFQHLADEHSDDRVRVYAASILNMLGEDVDPASLVMERLEEAAERSMGDFFAELIGAVQDRPLRSSLTKEQRRILHQQIKQSGPPRVLLQSLFEEDKKRIIFIGALSSKDGVRLSRRVMIEDILSLSRDRSAPLTHLALYLPPALQASFEAFKSGRDPDSFKDAVMQLGVLYGEEEQHEAVIDRFLDRMRRLLGHVDIIFLGASSDEYPWGRYAGELARDSMAQLLVDKIRSDDKARILVYGWELSVFRQHLLDTGGNRYFSLAASVGDRIGQDQVASVIEKKEGDWEDDTMLHRLHDLGVFLGISSYPLPTSFGIRTRGTMFERVLFHPDFNHTYADAWDGVIFRKEDDGGDPHFFVPPELPKPRVLDPTRDGAPVGAAPAVGLEESDHRSLLTEPVVGELATQGFSRQGREIFLNPRRYLSANPERTFSRAYLHTGLEEIQNLSNWAAVIPLKAGTPAEAIQFFNQENVQSSDVIFFNTALLTSQQMTAATPLATPPPGVIGLPEDTPLTTDEAKALADLSQQFGPIYIVNAVRFISQTGETILLIQAA